MTNRFKYDKQSNIIKAFMGDYDLGLYMCMVNEGKEYTPSSDGEIEIDSNLGDSDFEIKPIYGIFMLEDCYITKSGEIYKRLPTQRTKDGVEFIKRNHSAYRVQDIANKAFGLVNEIIPFKHS